MINKLEVLSAIRNAFADYEFSEVIKTSSPVIQKIVGVQKDDRELYLKEQRDKYFKSIESGSETMMSLEIEAALEVLSEYWNDATRLYEFCFNGTDNNDIAKSLARTYLRETTNYIALLYRLHLLHPTDELFSIENTFKGLSLDEIHDLLAHLGVMSSKRIVQLEDKKRQIRSSRSTESSSYEAAQYLDECYHVYCTIENINFLQAVSYILVLFLLAVN